MILFLLFIILILIICLIISNLCNINKKYYNKNYYGGEQISKQILSANGIDMEEVLDIWNRAFPKMTFFKEIIDDLKKNDIIDRIELISMLDNITGAISVNITEEEKQKMANYRTKVNAIKKVSEEMLRLSLAEDTPATITSTTVTAATYVPNEQVIEEWKRSSNNGLLINDKIITNISGPISFTFLKPRYENLPSQEPNDINKFPLIVLFGDAHSSTQNMCSECNCTAANQKCCLKLNSPEFLKNIDDLYKKNIVIDFYIETDFDGFNGGFSTNKWDMGGGELPPLGYFLTNHFMDCYYRVNRTGDGPSRCPTEYIRWHYADARRFGDKSSVQEVSEHKYYTDQTYETRFLKTFIFYMYRKNTPINIIRVEGTDDEYTSNGNKLIKYNEFRELLSTLIDDNALNFRNLFAKIIENTISGEYTSAFGKELKKHKDTFPNSWFADDNNLLDYYTDKLNNCNSLKNPANRPIVLSIITDFCEGKDISTNVNYSLLKNIFMKIGGIFIEIYTICRMFKSIENGQHSDISFIYMGHAHIINLIELLTMSRYYNNIAYIYNTLDDSRPTINYNNINYNNRCLDIIQHIDLNHEIEEHKKIYT
jgi:hypothetical protein